MTLIRQDVTFKKLIKHGFAERLALACMKQDQEQARLTVKETEKRDKKDLTSAELADYASRFLASEEGRCKAGNFDLRTGKFTDAITNALFKPWLRREVTPVFDEASFDEFLRGNGIDPIAMRTAQ